MASADRLFGFERGQGGAELEWIPLAVRMKLDMAGLKLGLDDWQALAVEERRSLVRAPADDGKFSRLLGQALALAGRSAPAPLAADKLRARENWLKGGVCPAELKGPGGLGVELDWPGLDPFDRFVLLHLAVRGRTEQLRAAAVELGLL